MWENRGIGPAIMARFVIVIGTLLAELVSFGRLTNPDSQ